MKDGAVCRLRSVLDSSLPRLSSRDFCWRAHELARRKLCDTLSPMHASTWRGPRALGLGRRPDGAKNLPDCQTGAALHVSKSPEVGRSRAQIAEAGRKSIGFESKSVKVGPNCLKIWARGGRNRASVVEFGPVLFEIGSLWVDRTKLDGINIWLESGNSDPRLAPFG